MLPRRLHISRTATETLKMMKGRTGLTPNIVCRAALLYSLQQGARGGQRDSDASGSEFNAPTLFGEHGPAIEALVRHIHGELDSKRVIQVIASHIDNGLEQLRRAKTLVELVEIGLA